MNILQLITRRQRRGAEVFAARLGTQLMGKGHEVVLAGLYAPPDRALRLPQATEADLSRQEPGLLPSSKIMKTLSMCIRDFDIQLVQANAGDTLKYAVLSRRLYGWNVPIVYRNASVMSDWASGWLRKRFNRWLLNQTEAIASVSRRSLKDIEEEMKIQYVRTDYIPNGVDCSKGASRARTPLDIPQETSVLLHVGAFTREKRHDLLLNYFERIATDASFPVHLILVGDGPLWSDIQRDAVEHPHADQITLTGTVEELNPYYDRADLLMLCSDIEGVPAAILEAAAKQVPAVAFDVGGLQECIRHEETGLLIDRGDEESYLRACLRLIEDDPLRRQYGQKARSFICQEYDISAICDAFEQLYEDVVMSYNK